jgi:hypothetical protein
MPLKHSKSKAAFSHNVKAEMDAGKPQDQGLAIAYAIKRKAKKKAKGGLIDKADKPSTGDTETETGGSSPGGASTGGVGSGIGGAGTGGAAPSEPKDQQSDSKQQKFAKGGYVNDSAKYQKRPMPSERDQDSKMVGRNSGNKASKNDSWTDNSTIEQAQRPSKTKLSRPKLVGSDAFSVRYKAEIDDDLDRMNSIPPQSDRAQPKQAYNEDGANRQGPKVRDMEAQHNNKKAPYIKEIEDQYSQDMAAAEMKKQQSYAEGGEVSQDSQSDAYNQEHGEIADREQKMRDMGGSDRTDALVSPSQESALRKKHGMAEGGRVEMEPSDSGIELIERHDESDLMDMLDPSEDEGDADAHSRNEEDQIGHGSGPDMEKPHNKNQRSAYADGGLVHEMMEQPHPEEDEEHHASVAAAIMAERKRGQQYSDSDEDRMVMMAEGGEILSDSDYDEIHSHGSTDSDDSSQVDLSRNADEDANEEDQLSFDALKKENYSESDGLSQLDSPSDSAQHGDDRERSKEDEHDESMISAIRRNMKAKARR